MFVALVIQHVKRLCSVLRDVQNKNPLSCIPLAQGCPNLGLHSVRLRLIFVCPQYETCIMSPFWRLEFLYNSYIFTKCMRPCIKLSAFVMELHFVKFKVSTVFLLLIQVFQDMRLYRWISVFGRFEGTQCLHVQGLRVPRRMDATQGRWVNFFF